MSGNPSPVTEATAPFVATTTPAIERANRLMALRTHPGFLDLIRLSQDLVNDAQNIATDFAGWDPQQIVVLKIRSQAAKEHHNLLMAKINEAIQQGIAEGKEMAEQQGTTKPAEEALEQGDFVRQQVLKKFDDMDLRPAGSY